MTIVCGAVRGDLACTLKPHTPGGHQAANGAIWFDADVAIQLLEFSVSSLNPEVGRKDDAGKLPYDLLLWDEVAQVVAVLQYGAKKYAPGNWKQVKDWRRKYFAAACRHLISWVTGEKLDPETGLHHLAHAARCVLFMLALDK